MNKEDIKKILPKIGSVEEIQMKQISPRVIMNNFEDAIKETYSNFLSAFTTETTKITEDGSEILSYSFYIVAFVGKGYNYKLFEVVPKQIDKPYPVELILFQNFPHIEGVVETQKEFSEKLFNIFKSGFTHNVINNLIAQVELYKESRSEN